MLHGLKLAGLEDATASQHAPRDACELVGERNGKHVAVQPLLGRLDPTLNRVAAFTNMRRTAAPDARMAIVCWRTLAENPWMEVPMTAVAQHLPPRPKPVPNAPLTSFFACAAGAWEWLRCRMNVVNRDKDVVSRALDEPTRRRFARAPRAGR
jgi:hypothetical protein